MKNSHLREPEAGAVPWCTRQDADLLLRLAVLPRSSREGFDGAHAGRLRLKVAAAPVDDAANARVIELLAELIGVPRRCIRILRGAHSRAKDVLVRDAGARWAQIAAAVCATVAQPGDMPARRAARKP
ncbi:MAG TPA: DUF167 family protein [Steroidobacteraceae bacterium]|nr:DUF167 family protein [Steroidobacteraceae bacterium]